MSSGFPTRRRHVVRLLAFLAAVFLAVGLFPDRLFAERPYVLFFALWAMTSTLAMLNVFLHALIVQLAGIALIILLSSSNIKFTVIDYGFLLVSQLVILVSISFLGYFRADRDDLQRQLTEQSEVLDALEGEKLAEVMRMRAVNRPAYFEELTVLFSDIRNFSGLAEILPADTLYSVLNDYYDGIVRIVRAHGGVIDKFLGDGIMVVFGLGNRGKDAPEAAVSCAIQIQEYQKEVARAELPGGFTIRAGLGIATGRVMVGLVGSSERFEWTCLGDPVNLAARLERMTRTLPTNILISETTYMQLRDRPAFLARVVGHFKVHGRFTEESVFEIYNGDEPALREGKTANREKFEKALKMSRHGFAEASRSTFREIHQTVPDDKIAAYYATAQLENTTT